VEAGRRREDGPYGPGAGRWITHTYWDTGADPNAYPSPHARRTNIVALDGHIQTISVAHYGPANHDAEYGRLGGRVFNWNGGFPNGDTSGAPRE
jgi:prepilin-type processing-associated H-X9-DG protein